MASPTQANRTLKVTSPLGDDVLLPTSFSGQEALSQLFHFDLQLLSQQESIDPKAIVGQRIGFSVQQSRDSQPRYFHGIVSRFHGGNQDSGFRSYHAEVVPWLWFLTKSSDCRVFQNKDVKQIIEEVLSDFGMTDFEIDQVKGSHAKREYCVQYNETHFAFLSRLMEEEGIFYFFRHEQGKHTLVLSDQNGVHKNCPDSQLEYEYTFTSAQRVPRLLSWNHSYQFTTGKWAQTDYNFENPARNQKTPAKILETNTPSVVKLTGNDKLEQFEYPGDYLTKGDGKSLTDRRMAEEEHTYDIVTATSGVSSLSCGGKFSVAKHPVPSEVGKNWVISEISHQATETASYTRAGGGGGGNVYSNSLTLIADSATYHPPRVTERPYIHGSQTAVVTGPAGEEIWPDKYGRVLVQFFWDRRGVRDDKSSCFVRVAQSAAGKGWGSMFIPRIGQEVVVTYLDGNPDRPLITGVVYNAEQMPAYELPAEKTKSYIKTNTSLEGEGFNELRFEDKKDNEQIFLHAERNMDVRVKNDKISSILHDRKTTIGVEKDGGDGNDELFVWGQKFDHIKSSYTIHSEGSMMMEIGSDEKSDSSWSTHVYNDRELNVKKNGHYQYGGNRATQVDGADSLMVLGNREERISQNWSHESGMAIHVKAGMTMVLEAGAQLTLKVGGNFIDINPGGVFIQGTMVMINSGGAPGTGKGANPETPTILLSLETEDPPTAADDSKTGQKSAPDSLT